MNPARSTTRAGALSAWSTCKGAEGGAPLATNLLTPTPAVLAAETGYECEVYILEAGRFQVELLCNLDQVPPAGAVIFCGFPRAVGGAGFTARCIAVCFQGLRTQGKRRKDR